MSDYAIFAVQHPDLSYLPSEASTLASSLNSEPIIGNITEQMIRQSLRGRTVNGLYLGTHATEDGIILSDGLMMPESLSGIINNSVVQGGWLFIPTCYGDEFMHHIQRGCVVDIITSISGQLPDKTAWSFVANIADSIRRNGEDIYQAWWNTRAQAGANFRFWPHPDNRVKMNYHQDSNGTKATLEHLRRDIDHIFESQSDISSRLSDLIGRVIALEIATKTTINVNHPSQWEIRVIIAGLIVLNMAFLYFSKGGG